MMELDFASAVVTSAVAKTAFGTEVKNFCKNKFTTPKKGKNHGKITSWWKRDQIELFRNIVELGDIIEISASGPFRIPVRQSVICVDRDDEKRVRVAQIHLPNGIRIATVLSPYQAPFRIELAWLDEIVGKKHFRINNSLDNDEQLRPTKFRKIKAKVDQILDSQEQGERVDFLLFSNNCEHFTTLCRYGVRKSPQVESFLAVTGTIGSAVKAFGRVIFISGVYRCFHNGTIKVAVAGGAIIAVGHVMAAVSGNLAKNGNGSKNFSFFQIVTSKILDKMLSSR